MRMSRKPYQRTSESPKRSRPWFDAGASAFNAAPSEVHLCPRSQKVADKVCRYWGCHWSLAVRNAAMALAGGLTMTSLVCWRCGKGVISRGDREAAVHRCQHCGAWNRSDVRGVANPLAVTEH